jgi:hypothetical protein
MKPLTTALVLASLVLPLRAVARKKTSAHQADTMTHPALTAQQSSLLAYCLHLATESSGFRISETEAFSPFVCLIDPQGKTSSEVLVGEHADQVRAYLGNLFAQIPAEMGMPAVVTSGQVKQGDHAEQVMDIFVLSPERHSALHLQGREVPKQPQTVEGLKRLGEIQLTIQK